MTVYKWSQTAATNASIDSTINWAEGQPPSSVNDSARAMMAAVAKYRDDVSGTILASGTSSAFTLTTNQPFSSYTEMRLSEITFICPATNAAGVTLNVNGFGALPINSVDATILPAGVMLGGGVYTVTAYTGEFILHAYTGNPFNTPLGGGMLYFGSSAPNNYFTFANGTAISRTTYATMFALVGTTYGAGDGSTTFNIPNLSGRVPAGREGAASNLTATHFGGNSTTLGATGGLESHTLTTAQLAVTTPAGTVSSVTATGTISSITAAGTISSITPAGTIAQITPAGSVSVTVTTPNVLSGGVSDNYTSVGGTGTWNSPTRGSLAATGSFTGTPFTPVFTGSSTTPIFSGSSTTPTFSGTGSSTPTFTGSSFGSGQAHNNVQPTFICNFIVRIL